MILSHEDFTRSAGQAWVCSRSNDLLVLLSQDILCHFNREPFFTLSSICTSQIATVLFVRTDKSVNESTKGEVGKERLRL